ncbi:hypothetical protein Trydic_g17263 [Trypoxylus dichotomus]
MGNRCAHPHQETRSVSEPDTAKGPQRSLVGKEHHHSRRRRRGTTHGFHPENNHQILRPSGRPLEPPHAGVPRIRPQDPMEGWALSRRLRRRKSGRQLQVILRRRLAGWSWRLCGAVWFSGLRDTVCVASVRMWCLSSCRRQLEAEQPLFLILEERNYHLEDREQTPRTFSIQSYHQRDEPTLKKQRTLEKTCFFFVSYLRLKL